MLDPTRLRPRPQSRSGARPAFTIVEMLVVVGIIVILVGLLLTALQLAGRTAQDVKTRALMNSIKQGVERFRADHGYIPPVLGRGDVPVSGSPAGTAEGQPGFGRDLLPVPGSVVPGDRGDYLQVYHSMTALPEYLLGYDSRLADGYGYVPEGSALVPPDQSRPGYREFPILGIRDPGRDGFWNGTANPRAAVDGRLFIARNPGNIGFASSGNADPIRGKVYGPYVDIKVDDILGEVEGLDYALGTPNGQRFARIVRPGDEGYGQNNRPKVFLDYWGSPIRWYRQPPATLADASSRDTSLRLDPLDDATELTLADVIVLRPFRIEAGNDIDGVVGDAAGDFGTVAALRTAEYALFSPGPDRSANDVQRADEAEFNKDNIVEVGP